MLSSSSSDEDSPISIQRPPSVVGVVSNEHERNNKALSDVTWDDVIEDHRGEAFSVIGYELTALASNQLRTICSKLELKGLKNAKKSVMVEAIKAKYKFVKGYDALDATEKQRNEAKKPGSTATRKEAQCTFQLINLLFSDKFAEDFSKTGRSYAYSSRY